VLRVAAALPALLALAAPEAVRAEAALSLWAEAGSGADGNPGRIPGAAPVAHGFASLLGRARLRLDADSTAATITVTEAGRLYPGIPGADALASRLEAAGRAELGAGLVAGLSGLATDWTERDGLLDRHTLRGEGSVGLRRGPLLLTLAGAWALFAPRERSLRPFRASGPEGWLRATWTPVDEHQVTAALGVSQAGFPGWAALGAPGATTRNDQARHLAAEWSWSGAALAGLGWQYTQNGSSAPGGDFTRHRLTASSALWLPLDLTLAARLALQWTSYPDPLLLAEQQRLAEGQESLDAVEGRLTRQLTGPLEVSLSVAWYHAQGGAGVPGYQRTVATLSLGWRARPEPR
jgi:hypothetical protein